MISSSTSYIVRSTEEQEQEVVVQWARASTAGHPELALLHHIPNGGARSKREAAKLKRMGVLAGAPDLHLPVSRCGYNSLYIEMKTEGGRLSESQRAFLKTAAAENNYCVACYSAEDAIGVLKCYMRGLPLFENLAVVRNGKRVSLIR